MPRNKTAVSDLGSIDAHGTEFRAHIQCRGNAGEQKHIRGPSRGSQHEAQRDLDQLRKAGSIGTTREEGLSLAILLDPMPANLLYRTRAWYHSSLP